MKACITSRARELPAPGAAGIRRGALTGRPASKIQKVRHIQEGELYAPWDSEISLGALIELPVSRIRRTFWCSRRAADAENHGRLQHTQGGELTTPGLWISARVLRVAGIEDPESSLVSLTMVPASRIREAAAHRRPVSLPLLGFGDLPGCSDRAADAQDPGSCSTPRTGKVSAPGLERSRRVP